MKKWLILLFIISSICFSILGSAKVMELAPSSDDSIEKIY